MGTPPRRPDLQSLARHPRLGAFFLRALGARFDPAARAVIDALEAVPHLSPCPQLLVHGERDLTYPRHDFRLLWEKARAPKEMLVLKEAGHAELTGGFREVAHWLKDAAKDAGFGGGFGSGHPDSLERKDSRRCLGA